MLQVAEGGMDQIGNMLPRLKELAIQAASSSVGASDRVKINAEGDALISEIDRIANSTKYGSTSLLDGTFGATKDAGTFTLSAAAASKGVYGELTHIYSATGTGAALDTTATMSGAWTLSPTGTNLTLGNGSVSEVLAATTWSATSGTKTLAFANLRITFTTTSASDAMSVKFGIDTAIQIRETGLTNLNVTNASSATFTFSNAAANAVALGNGTITQTISGLTIGESNTLNFDKLGVTFTLDTNYTGDDLNDAKFLVTSTGSGGNTFQIGTKNDSNNKISLTIAGVGASTLNSGLVVGQLDSQSEAQSMLTTVDSAISSLASARGTIGAYTNRLSYASANRAWHLPLRTHRPLNRLFEMWIWRVR